MADIKPFATCTDDELTQYIKMHYAGEIDLTQYWSVGDTRVMHLNAMPATPPYASESHVEQDMTMVIIGMNHDTLVTPINGNDKAVITLQCKELLGNNGKAEWTYIWGSSTSTTSDSNYSKNPRRTWLNGTFVNSLPSYVQSLVKTVIKKNLANHTDNTEGPDTEDKAFLTSYPEMFGLTSYSYYKGRLAMEGYQYEYYNSNTRRTKSWNKNGVASGNNSYYWLRSPSSRDSNYWIGVSSDGSATSDDSNNNRGLAPAFCLAAEPDIEPSHKLLKNGKIIQGIYKNGKKLLGVAHAGELIWKYEEPKPKYPTPEEAPFATATDEQIGQVLEAYYNGLIDINDYWKVGDTRVMHLNAMASGSGGESHVAQDMTMVIIGINHDNLKESINGISKSAITLQCKECLGNNGTAENVYIWGSSTSTTSDSNYSKNPRRTWLNGTFVNSLPSAIQPLVKTVIKKNLANHTDSTEGPDTEDKAFLTSYPEMFGLTSYSYYKGRLAMEGYQYEYYNSDTRRTKHINKNGSAGDTTYYWLRSPSSSAGDGWIVVFYDGTAYNYYSNLTSGLAPAFCL